MSYPPPVKTLNAATPRSAAIVIDGLKVVRPLTPVATPSTRSTKTFVV